MPGRVDGRAIADRLEGLEPSERAAALAKFLDRGLLADIDGAPERTPQRCARLSVKQQALWGLVQDGSLGDFYHCGALWWFPGVDVDRLSAAYRAVAEHTESLRLSVREKAGEAVAALVDPTPPERVTIPDGTADPEGWVRSDASTRASRSFDLGASATRAVIYDADGSGWSALALCGHDIALDNQGLHLNVGPAIAAHLRGDEHALDEIRPSDFADWQRRRLTEGVLMHAVAQRRDQLAASERPPWPVSGDRDGECLRVDMPEEVAQRLARDAAKSGVSVAAILLSRYHRALAHWDGRLVAVPIGCCTSYRLRPELRSTVGNLTNTVVVEPSDDWLTGPDPEVAAHDALLRAMDGLDIPFELVYGDGTAQDEQIGIRYTFLERPVTAGGMRAEDIAFDYVKSVLSLEVRRDDEQLDVTLQCRTREVPDADGLVEILERAIAGELTDRAAGRPPTP